MVKQNPWPTLGIIALLGATAASATLAGTATTTDDAVARILLSIALALLATAVMVSRRRDARARRAHGDASSGKAPGPD
ncbi:hypothetical protein [Streptomyces naphthomycinicus]|uniref:hypothetical protein n=1 Tax=Streptomyces naphthomycinicus TaxID=2872625 RepID=UPI001CEC8284|nr:hypothetical protein [Streptomyces sp. TML10]